MRRASGPTVTLFPFLTVLLCASGTLIVLLIALSRHVRETPPVEPDPAAPPTVEAAPEPVAPDPIVSSPPAQAPPPEAPTVPAGPPRVVRLPYRGPDPAEPFRKRLAAARRSDAELSARMAATAGRLTMLREATTAARRQTAEALATVRDARVRLASLEQNRTAGLAAKQRATEEIDAFRDRIAAAETRADAPRSLLPVVRTADGVTADRPILIECTAAGAALRPYGVTVPTAVAGLRPDGSSAIAAGVAEASALTGEGYVLLIVRPDGLPAFYRTADALSAADRRFGYELLDAEAEIEWGETSDANTARVAAAVRNALARGSFGPREPGFAGSDGSDFVGGGGPTGGTGFARTGGAVGGPGPGSLGGGGRTGTSGNNVQPPGAGGGDPFQGAPRGTPGDSTAAAGLPAERAELLKNFPAGSPADRVNVDAKSNGAGSGSSPFAPDQPWESGAAAPPAEVGGNARPANGESLSEATGAGAGGGGSETPQNRTGDRGADGRAARSASQAGSGANAGRPSIDGGATGGRPGGTASQRTVGAAGTAGAGRGGGAPDTRIRFAVRTPATLAASHLWIGGRWAPLPADDDRLDAVLSDELARGLADRGEPPAGFRWSPDVRLSVRPDGRRSFSRVSQAFQRLGATVKIEGEPR